jgi:hypothetical protein
VVGTSISNGLLALRQKLDPTFVSQVGGRVCGGVGARVVTGWSAAG